MRLAKELLYKRALNVILFMQIDIFLMQTNSVSVEEYHCEMSRSQEGEKLLVVCK